MRAVLVLVLAAACGDGITPPDATVEPDAPRGLVTVKLVTGDSPAGQPVYFQNADSSLVLATRTGLDGTANAFMVPGGFATILLGSEIYTWYDVQPDDVLVLEAQGVRLPGDELAALNLSAPQDPGQRFYQLATACGTWDLGANPAVPMLVAFASCSDRQDLLVQSYDAGFGASRYLFESDVAFDGGSHAMTGTYRPVDAWSVEVHGVQAGVFEMNATATLLDDGFEIFSSQRGGSFPIEGGAGIETDTMFLPAGATMMTTIGSTFGSQGVGSPRVILWGPPQATTVIDAAAVVPREYTEPPVYDRATHALQWREATVGVQANVLRASFGWSDSTPGGSYRWQVLAPRTAETILRLPHLPLPDLTPGENAVIARPFIFTSISAPGGYAAVRTRLPIDWTPGSTWPIDGPSGVVGIEELGTGGFD